MTAPEDLKAQAARACEISGEAATLAEALDQWELERDAMAELFDDNQALGILARRFDIVVTLAVKTINALELDAALFMSQKTRDQIQQVRDECKKLEAAQAEIKQMTADANDRRKNVKAQSNP